MNYKAIETTRRILTYPFRLLMVPLFVIIAFTFTNFQDEWEREFYFKSIKNLLKPV